MNKIKATNELVSFYIEETKLCIPEVKLELWNSVIIEILIVSLNGSVTGSALGHP